MSAATVVLKQRRILNAFRDARATDAANAINLTAHGIRDSFALQRLVQRGVLKPVPPDRWYLDEAAAAQLQTQRRTILLVLLLVALVLFVWSATKG